MGWQHEEIWLWLTGRKDEMKFNLKLSAMYNYCIRISYVNGLKGGRTGKIFSINIIYNLIYQD